MPVSLQRVREWHGWDWLAPAAAALGLVALTAMFGLELLGFRQAIVGWAERDLLARTELAAATLSEPLTTSDFRRIHAFGDECVKAGVRLTVFSANGGVFFDTLRQGAEAPDALYASHRCGEFTVRLGLPRSRVLEPVDRARRGLVLAGCLGGFAVLIVFFFTFRQRIRIRELARLERFRRDFIADVSHEIKTPLTGILGSVDLMGDEVGRIGAKDSPLGRLMDLVRNESRRLNSLVQSILDLARLEREGRTLALADCEVPELIASAIAAVAPQARERQVRLTASEGCADPRMARVDAALVVQALVNLLVNAVRHSGSPEVMVTVGVRGRDLELAVEDRGVGIPPEHRARIFERFHRVDPSRSAESGGAGLGLAIVRGIAQSHGGEVRLESVEPHGCRFVLMFPGVLRS